MSSNLPPEIVVVASGDDVCYYLPRPQTGTQWIVGWLVAALGLGPIALAAWAFRALSAPLPAADGPWDFRTILGWLGPLLLVLVGVLVGLSGAWLIAGHCEITVTAGRLRGARCLGPLRWPRRCGRGRVLRLVVEQYSRDTGPWHEWWGLIVETDGSRPRVLASPYPGDWLRALAGDLAGRCGGGPVPVVERVAGRDTSRDWRRDLLPGAVRRAPRYVGYLFGLLFFGVGTLFFVGILLELVRGDSEHSFLGDYPIKLLWVIFPVPHMLIGAGVLLVVFLTRVQPGLSPERVRAESAAAPRDEAGVIAPAEAEYPTVPALVAAPGRELPAGLPRSVPAGLGVASLLVLVLICSGVLAPLTNYAINHHGASPGKGPAFAELAALFLGFFWLILTVFLLKEWRKSAVARPAVEVSAFPLNCGEGYELLVAVPGPERLRRLRVTMVCEEQTSYTEGTATRQETRRVYEQALVQEEELDIASGSAFRSRRSFRVPGRAMHSFKAEHNEVRWLLRVEVRARRLVPLRVTHDYPLSVRPPRGHGGRTCAATT